MQRVRKRNVVTEILRAGVCGLALAIVLAGGGQAVSASSKKVDQMVLVAKPNDKIMMKKFGFRGPSFPTLMKPSVNPTANIVRSGKGSSDSPLDTLQIPRNPSFAQECVVDFSDEDALHLLEFALEPFAENTFAYAPWWHQNCTGITSVDVRPIWPTFSGSHFHLSYENLHIMPCSGFSDWGIPQEDGSCVDIDPSEEPRSLAPHFGSISTRISVSDGVLNGNDKKPFRLNRIRVENSQAIQLCYKPVQEIDGPWISTGGSGSTEPGIWFCWNELPTGNWDLSDWTDNITEVKIRASHGSAGIYQIDDIGIGVY